MTATEVPILLSDTQINVALSSPGSFLVEAPWCSGASFRLYSTSNCYFPIAKALLRKRYKPISHCCLILGSNMPWCVPRLLAGPIPLCRNRHVEGLIAHFPFTLDRACLGIFAWCHSLCLEFKKYLLQSSFPPFPSWGLKKRRGGW